LLLLLLYGTLLSTERQCQWPSHRNPNASTARNRRTFTVAAYYSQGYLAPGFDLDYPYQPSPLYSYSASTASDQTLLGDQQFTPPNYHISEYSPRPSKRPKVGEQNKPVKGGAKNIIQMPTPESAADAVNKPKRVRTGCLTCRERHLKCDEGLPNCQNCRKSSRVCKRGVRLNFIDTTVKSPPMIPPTADWKGRWILQVNTSNANW
jgi:hypothetical protein